MSPVQPPPESKKLPASAMGAADDNEGKDWGDCFPDDNDLLHSETINEYKERKPLKEKLDELAREMRYGSTGLRKEKTFGPFVQSRLEMIGEGNFGNVYKCWEKGGKTSAIKVTKDELSDNMKRKKALREVKIWADIGSNDNIVKLTTHWFKSNKLYIKMEWCDTCLSSKKTLEPSEAMEMIYQVSKGLDFIHGHGIAHLDVKPDNMYFSNGFYKLGDFGCAEYKSNKEAVEGGDRRYMPTEIVKGDTCEHLDKVDVFSLGISTYELMSGEKLPREGDEFDMLRKGNLDSFPKFPDGRLGCLIKSMMHPYPEQRPSAKDILNKLKGELSTPPTAAAIHQEAEG